MKTLKELEINFLVLLEELKNDDLSTTCILKKFEVLINDFEAMSKNDIDAINQLKKDFKQLFLIIIKLKKIDSKITSLEENIKVHNNKLELIFK